MRRLHIFRAGRRTTASGQTIEFSAADMAASAAAYSPELHEAPLVVGHPRTDDPAYGWVASLSADGADLHAVAGQVNADFAELVQQGAFKKVSSSFYRPDAPNNPAPGTWYLRHVGFLGAQPPSVKGLRPPEFADDEEGVVEFEEADFADPERMATMSSNVWRRVRDFFIEKFGIEDADKALPGWLVDDMAAEAARDDDRSSFAEPEPIHPTDDGMDPEKKQEQDAQFAERESALTEKEQALKEREAKLAEQEAGRQREAHVAFAEGLVKAGKLLPALRATAVEALVQIEQAEGATVQFGEGDEAEEKPLLGAVKQLLESLPEQVDFSERAAPDQDGEALDVEDARALSRAAVDFQEAEAGKGRHVSMAEAVAHVKKQHAKA